MKLTELAIKAVGENRRLINRLALEFDKHSGTVERWIRDNEKDGDLTKATSLNIILEETGLTQKEILTNE